MVGDSARLSLKAGELRSVCVTIFAECLAANELRIEAEEHSAIARVANRISDNDVLFKADSFAVAQRWDWIRAIRFRNGCGVRSTQA
jgi:hypothetical protein